MKREFTIQQIAEAAQVTRHQVEAWISRGHFAPENSVESGKARKFTLRDAITLGTLAEFVRLGLSPTIASQHLLHLHGFDDEDALLIICQGPLRISETLEFVDEDGSIGHTFARITRPSQVARVIDDPEIRSFATVNLGHVERRMMKNLA